MLASRRPSPEQILDADRQAPDALAGGVIDGVHDRRRRAHHRDFTDALDAGDVQRGVGLVEQFDLDVADVRVHGHDIVGQIIVEDAPVAGIDLAYCPKGRAQSPDHAAANLADGRTVIHHPSAVGHAHDAWNMHPAGASLAMDLRKVRDPAPGAERRVVPTHGGGMSCRGLRISASKNGRRAREHKVRGSAAFAAPTRSTSRSRIWSAAARAVSTMSTEPTEV